MYVLQSLKRNVCQQLITMSADNVLGHGKHLLCVYLQQKGRFVSLCVDSKNSSLGLKHHTLHDVTLCHIITVVYRCSSGHC